MDDLKRKYLGLIAGAPDEAGLEDLRVAALGKKGEISGLMKSLGGMSTEERQSAGRSTSAAAALAKPPTKRWQRLQVDRLNVEHFHR